MRTAVPCVQHGQGNFAIVASWSSLVCVSNIILTIYECWAVKKNYTRKLHTTELRMLRWARGKTKKDHFKNEDICREANIDTMTTFFRKRRHAWNGLVLRNEGEATTKNM